MAVNKQQINLSSEKEKMIGPFQEEKKQVIDKVENWLVDNIKSESNFSYASGGVKGIIEQIIIDYEFKCYNNNTNREGWIKLGNMKGREWVENLSKAQNKEDIKFVESFLINVIIAFNCQETAKFREVERKIKELEEENQKGNIDKEKASQLINELQPFSTTIF